MKVDVVYIAVHKLDYEFAKVSATSVRFWYPDVSIMLLKDMGSGDFSTRELETRCNVGVYNIPKKKYGWGYIKLEPLFDTRKHSFLVLDSDTVMLGPVLDRVQSTEAPFAVDDEVQDIHRIKEIYLSPESIQDKVNKRYIYPGYSFNTGQWFGTSGMLNRSDFEDVLIWSTPPKHRYDGVVFNGDQGCLNYVLHWKDQNQQLQIQREPLMFFPSDANYAPPSLSNLASRQVEEPRVLHWAGINMHNLRTLPYREYYSFYRNLYYQSSPLKKRINRVRQMVLCWEKKVKARLK